MTFIEQIESLTTKDYKRALTLLQKSISRSQMRMLEAHYQAPDNDITATELAHAMNFAKFNASNRHYGGLAAKLCNFFGINPPTKLYVMVEFEKRQGEWHWLLRPHLVNALHELKWFDEIQNYIRYHNSEKTGVSCLEFDYNQGFGVSTSKSVSNLLGNRIWLIGGFGNNPRQYYLCNYFTVDKVGPSRDKRFFKYFVAGQTGVAFEPPILLNNQDWFSEFLQSQRNFHLGLRKLDRKDVTKFEKLIANHEIPTGIERHVVITGGGFGNPETNRMVEKASISLVTKDYEERGWSVKSVEQKRIGFDLLCNKGLMEEHVEVKGTQGDVEAFLITSGEVQQSRMDKQFVLYVVTLALSTQPQLHRHTANTLEQKFILTPLSYHAAIK